MYTKFQAGANDALRPREGLRRTDSTVRVTMGTGQFENHLDWQLLLNFVFITLVVPTGFEALYQKFCKTDAFEWPTWSGKYTAGHLFYHVAMCKFGSTVS